MKTQTQRFNALVRKHESTSHKAFSRHLLANVDYKPNELKQFIEDELYFWLNIQRQAVTSEVQWHLGNKHYYKLSYCEERIALVKEVIAEMQYKVYTDTNCAFFAINPTKIRPHFIKFN